MAGGAFALGAGNGDASAVVCTQKEAFGGGKSGFNRWLLSDDFQGYCWRNDYPVRSFHLSFM